MLLIKLDNAFLHYIIWYIKRYKRKFGIKKVSPLHLYKEINTISTPIYKKNALAFQYNSDM